VSAGTSLLLAGGIVVLLASAGIVWRFVQKKRVGRLSFKSGVRVPHYWASGIAIFLGYLLQIQAILVYSDPPPAIFSWFVAGLSWGALLFVPGILVLVSKRDSGSAEHSGPPTFGWVTASSFLILLGVMGGLIWPITLLLLGN
jgi:hypothetical protein